MFSDNDRKQMLVATTLEKMRYFGIIFVFYICHFLFCTFIFLTFLMKQALRQFVKKTGCNVFYVYRNIL